MVDARGWREGVFDSVNQFSLFWLLILLGLSCFAVGSRHRAVKRRRWMLMTRGKVYIDSVSIQFIRFNQFSLFWLLLLS